MSRFRKQVLVLSGGLAAVLAMTLALILVPVALAASPIYVGLIDNSWGVYLPGEAIHYSAMVENVTDAPISGVALSFTPPNLIDADASSWSCTYQGASGSIPADGSGNVSGTVDLEVGGYVTLDIACQTLPEATGDLSATFTAKIANSDQFPGGVTESATDTVARGVFYDPAVLSKSDAVEVYEPGGSVTYTIVLSNTGETQLTGIALVDKLPAQVDVANAAWDTAADQASCSPASGTGDVASTVDLQPGGSVTLTVTCPILPDAVDEMTNGVSATLKGGSEYWADDTDANSADTTDTTSSGSETTEGGKATTTDDSGGITTAGAIDSGSGQVATNPGTWAFGALALVLAGGALYSLVRPSRRRG